MDLNELAGLGRISKEIEPIKNVKIKVHSLTVKEEEEIYSSLASVPDDALVKTSTLQIETLVRAIETINGEKFREIDVLKTYLKGLQRHVLSLIWQSWMKEIEDPSIKEIEALKKNSEILKVA